MRTTTPFRSLLAALILTASAGACDDASIVAPGPAADDSTQLLTRTSSLERIAERAASGALRLEIEVRAGGPPWVAREVEVENDDDDDEKIESRIVAADAAAGTLELRFGGLVVEVAGARRFRAEGSGDLTREGFFTRVQAALAAGRAPGVELRRPLPSAAQAPNDPTFRAVDVRLDDDADVGKLEVLVDARHLATGTSGAGRITVLGVDVVVDPALGTEIGERTDDGDGAVEIEGLVARVDAASGRVELLDGRTVWIVAGTRFDDDDDDDLTSLAQVADALAAGHPVEMEAEAVQGDDGSWIAVEVEFEIEDDADDDDLPGTTEFEGRLAAVDLTAGTFTLTTGGVFQITEATIFEGDGDLFSLSAAAAALASGVPVEMEGDALAEATAPGRWLVVRVKIETDD